MFNKVVLIDDDVMELKYVENMISKSSLIKETVTFSKGSEAIEYLKNTSVEEFPEIILVDIDMPELNGHQIVEKVKCLPQFILSKSNIAYLTGNASMDNLIEAAIKEVELFIRKPLTINKLKDVTVMCSAI